MSEQKTVALSYISIMNWVNSHEKEVRCTNCNTPLSEVRGYCVIPEQSSHGFVLEEFDEPQKVEVYCCNCQSWSSIQRLAKQYRNGGY